MLTLIYHLNTKFNLSVATLVIIEVLSSLQILQAPLRALFQSAASYKSVAIGFYKDISFITGIINTDNFTITDQLLQATWGCIVVYFVLHLLTIITVTLYYGLYKRIVNKKVLNAINISYLFHSRIAFFLTQAFFFLFLELFSKVRNSSNNSILYQNSWFIMTVILSVFNVILAFIKEFILYQFSKGKDFTGIKTNLYHQIALVYKTISLILSFFNQDSTTVMRVSSIVNIFLSTALVYILYSRLPFYNLTVLRTTTIMTAVILSCSTMSILNTFVKDKTVLNGLQVFFFLFPILMIKIFLSILKIAFQRILKGSSKSPAQVLHLAILIELASEDEQFSSQSRKAAFPDLYMLNQTLNVGLDPDIKANSQAAEENKVLKLSKCIIEILGDALLVHPDSELLLLNMAEIYFYKLHNIPKAIEFIKKLKAENPSIAARTFIEEFYWDFENAHMNEYFDSEKQLELVDYFEYNEETEIVKIKIMKEIDYHLNLWTEVRDNKIDVKKIVEYSMEIDKLFNRIDNHFTRQNNSFKQQFVQAILMHAVYLDKIRSLPIEGLKTVQKFQMIRNNVIHKNGFNIHSGTKALVMISLDKRNVGEVLEASGSIETLFGTKKRDLIGTNFSCLFANDITKIHQYFVQQFAKSPDHKLDYKVKTYGKTADGDLFEVEAHFILYPHLKKEISIMILFQKLSEPQSLIIVDYDNTVVDFSNQLEEAFQEEKFNISTATLAQDLNSQFGTIHQAFDAMHKVEIGFQGAIAALARERVHGPSFSVMENFASPKSGVSHPTMAQTNAERGNITILSEGDDQQRLIKDSIYSPKFFPKSPFLRDKMSPLKKSRDEMPIEKAREIFDKYSTGNKMSFALEDLRGVNRKVEIIANVQLSIFSLEGITYKIITVTDPKKGSITMEKNIQEEKDSSEESKSSKTFGDEFEAILEREFIVLEELLNINQRQSEVTPTQTPTTQLNLKKSQNVLIESARNIDSAHTLQFDFKKKKNRSKNKKDHEGHQVSSTSSVIKEAKITRALNEITNSKKIQPSLKYVFIIIYVILICMIALAIVNFNLTNNSIRSVESGVEIVNLATARLQYGIKILQFTLLLYTASIGLASYPAQTIAAFKYTLIDDIHRLKDQSDALKTAVSYMNEKSLLDRVFTKNINFMTPIIKGQTYYGKIDTFTANDILYNKYIILSEFTNIRQLAAKDDILYTFNNTANDYLLSSKNIIEGTEIFLKSLIKRNLFNLKIILSIEAFALVLLSFVLIIPLLIITRAYNRLFRALIKVKEELVLERVNQLLKAKTLFSEDIDTLSFYNLSIDTINAPEPKRAAKKIKNMDAFTNNRTYITTGVTQRLFKIVIVPLLLSIAFEIFFGVNLIESISTFNSFEKMNNQIISLNDASYQADLFICVFAFYFIFPATYNFRIYNQLPKNQLIPPLDKLKNFNEDFTTLFLTDDDGALDSVIEDVLKGPLCKYVHKQFIPDCLSATKGESNGLLAINSDYIGASNELLTSIAAAKSVGAAVQIIAKYNAAVMSDLTVIKEIYPAIVNHIVSNLNKKANSTLDRGVGFFVAIILFALAYQLFIYILPIRKLSEMDNGRRMVLKTIPYNIIEESKILNFYLVNEFRHEVQGMTYFL